MCFTATIIIIVNYEWTILLSLSQQTSLFHGKKKSDVMLIYCRFSIGLLTREKGIFSLLTIMH